MNKTDNTKYDEDFDRSIWEDILSFSFTFIAVSLVIVLMAYFIIKPAVVSGRSMYPTFKDGQRGFSNILSLSFQGLNRGDVVVAKVTLDDGTQANVVKRVIGLPGETISSKNGQIYIGNTILNESVYLNDYVIEQAEKQYGYYNQDFDPVTLKEDEYFLMGDNRPISKDSRDLGPFKSSQILSKDFFTIYPLEEFGYYS